LNVTTQNPDDNPFAPPSVQSIPVTDVQRPALGWLIFWMIVFCANLPLPVWLGVTVTSSPGHIGMIFGCLVVNVTGIWLCRVAPYFMLRLSVGALPVALSQFFGVLHMFVGMAAVAVSRWILNPFAGSLSGDMIGEMTRVDEVTVATILTGIGLILPSIAIGYLAGMLFSLPSAARTRQTE
jgi:cobalamin synthase